MMMRVKKACNPFAFRRLGLLVVLVRNEVLCTELKKSRMMHWGKVGVWHQKPGDHLRKFHLGHGSKEFFFIFRRRFSPGRILSVTI